MAKNKQIGTLSIPALATGDKPTLVAIYPSQDSLPDNLLKIYLHFSRPMRESQPQPYILLVKIIPTQSPAYFLTFSPNCGIPTALR